MSEILGDSFLEGNEETLDRGDVIPKHHQCMYWAMLNLDLPVAHDFRRCNDGDKETWIDLEIKQAKLGDEDAVRLIAEYTKQRMKENL